MPGGLHPRPAGQGICHLKTIEENPEEYYSIFGLNKGLELIRVFGKDGTVLETSIVKKVEAAEYETKNGFLRVQVEWEDGTRQSWFYDIEGCRRSKGFPADAEYIGKIWYGIRKKMPMARRKT